MDFNFQMEVDYDTKYSCYNATNYHKTFIEYPTTYNNIIYASRALRNTARSRHRRIIKKKKQIGLRRDREQKNEFLIGIIQTQINTMLRVQVAFRPRPTLTRSFCSIQKKPLIQKVRHTEQITRDIEKLKSDITMQSDELKKLKLDISATNDSIKKLKIVNHVSEYSDFVLVCAIVTTGVVLVVA